MWNYKAPSSSQGLGLGSRTCDRYNLGRLVPFQKPKPLMRNFRELATEFAGWVSLHTQVSSVTSTAPVSRFDPRLLIFLLPIQKHPHFLQHRLKRAKRGPNTSGKVPTTGEAVALERMSTFDKMHITAPMSFMFYVT